MSDEHPTSPPPHQATNDDGPPLPSSSLVEELPPGNSFPSTAIDAVDYFLKQSLQKIDDLHELGALAAVCNLIGEDRTKVNEIQIYGSTGGFDCPGTITFWSDAQRLVTLNMEPLTGRVFTIQKREAEPGVSDTYSIGPLIPAEHQEHFQDFKLKLLADRRAGDMYMQSSRKRIFCFQAGNTWSAISTSQYSNVFSLGLLKAFLAENFRSKADFEDVGTLEELRRRTIVIVGLIPPQGNPEVVRPADFFLWMAYQPYDAIKLILDHYHLTVSPCVGAFLCRVCVLSHCEIRDFPHEPIRRCSVCGGATSTKKCSSSVLCKSCQSSLSQQVFKPFCEKFDLLISRKNASAYSLHPDIPLEEALAQREVILADEPYKGESTLQHFERLIANQCEAVHALRTKKGLADLLFPNQSSFNDPDINFPFRCLPELFMYDRHRSAGKKCKKKWECEMTHDISHCSPLKSAVDRACPQMQHGALGHLKNGTATNQCTPCRLLRVSQHLFKANLKSLKRPFVTVPPPFIPPNIRSETPQSPEALPSHMITTTEVDIDLMPIMVAMLHLTLELEFSDCHDSLELGDKNLDGKGSLPEPPGDSRELLQYVSPLNYE